jgi:hypothetical protein
MLIAWKSAGAVAAPGSQSAEAAPFLCMDCGERGYDAAPSYRSAARTIGDCGACGEGPLVDTRERGVVEALLMRDGQRQAAKRQRASLAATCVAAALALPLVTLCFHRLHGLLATTVVCLATTGAMIVIGWPLSRLLFRSPCSAEARAVEVDMRRGWVLLRPVAALVLAALLTAALWVVLS